MQGARRAEPQMAIPLGGEPPSGWSSETYLWIGELSSTARVQSSLASKNLPSELPATLRSNSPAQPINQCFPTSRLHLIPRLQQPLHRHRHRRLQLLRKQRHPRSSSINQRNSRNFGSSVPSLRYVSPVAANSAATSQNFRATLLVACQGVGVFSRRRRMAFR